MLNEILGTAARFNGLLSRKFNITGGAPAPQLTPEIGCGLSIELGPEDRLPMGDTLAYGYVDVTGAAGQRAASMLRNPAGSNILLVVERVAVQPVTVAQPIVIGILQNAAGFPQLPAAGEVGCRDTRVGNDGGVRTRLPNGKVSGATNTPPTAIVNGISTLPSNAAAYPQPYEVPAPNGCICVLSPGWAIEAESQLVAGRFQTWFFWREVPMAPGEVGPF